MTAPRDTSTHLTPVVVFGAGSGSIGVEETARAHGWEVIAYADNDPAKQGATLRGKPIVPPGDIPALRPAAVVAASVHQEAMADELRALGFGPDRIWFYGYANLDQRGYVYRPDADATGAADPEFDALLAANTWTTLQIGLTDRCNLYCAHCSRTPENAGANYTLPLNDFARLLDGFDPARHPELMLSDYGETTLVPNLPDYLREAYGRGWRRMTFFTNGTCLRRDLFETLLAENLLTSLTVSVEAVSPALYRRIRGQDVDRLHRFLAMIRELADMHAPRFALHLNATCMRLNEAEWEPILEVAARYGAASVNYACMFPFYTAGDPPDGKVCVPGQQITGPDADTCRYRDIFGRIADRGRELDVAVQPAIPVDNAGPAPARGPFRCAIPLSWTQVGLDGAVYPCCQVSKRYALGNVYRQSFDEMVRGPRAGKLLTGLRTGGDPVPVCRECGVLAGYNF